MRQQKDQLGLIIFFLLVCAAILVMNSINVDKWIEPWLKSD